MNARALFAAVCLIFCGFCRSETVTIIGINDIHSALDMMPRLQTFVRETKAADPGALLLCAGDTRTGHPACDQYKHPGRPVIDLMNRIGFDAAGLGLHDADGGPTALRDNMRAAHFPFICANALPDTKNVLPLHPYRIFTRKGVRIGVLGLTCVGSGGFPTGRSAALPGITFRNALQVATEFRRLRSECHVLVLLTHQGFDQDRKLAALLPEADLILGGGSLTPVNRIASENGVLIAHTAGRASHATKVSLEVEEGRVVSKKAETISMDLYPPDADLGARVAEYNATPAMQRVVGHNELPMVHREAIGCFETDAIRYATQADIVVQNYGNIRIGMLPAGPITVADVHRIDVYGNDLVELRLRPAELVQMLAALTKADGHGSPCVAGITYKGILDSSFNLIITDIRDLNGKTLDPNKRYRVVTNDYAAAVTPGLPVSSARRLGLRTSDAIFRYLDKVKSINYTDSGRAVIRRQ